jgi:hypothetical protein
MSEVANLDRANRIAEDFVDKKDSDLRTGSLRVVYFAVAVIVAGELLQFAVYRNHVRFSGGTDFLLYAKHSDDILNGIAPNIILKPFGCGAWLALYRLLFGDNMAGFASFNAAALGLLPFLAFVFGWSLRGVGPALLCALLVAISPACAMHSVLAETPALFFLALSLTTVAIFQKTKWLWLTGAGAVFLVAAWLCRPDSLVYGIGAVLLSILPVRGLTKFRGAICFTAVAGILLFAVCQYNKPMYGRALPVRYDAYLRYILVFDTGKTYEIDPASSFVPVIRQSLIQSGAVDEKDLVDLSFLTWNRGWWVIRESLAETNGSHYEADRIMSEASTSVIRANMLSFAKDAARTFASFTAFRPMAGAYTFSGFESKPDYPWRRFDYKQQESPETSPTAERLFSAIVAARENRPFNNWNIPYNARYIRFLSVSFIVVYPAILLLVFRTRGLLRLQFLALFLGPILAYTAYATTGFFDYRYLLIHSWPLWLLTGFGISELNALWLRFAARKRSTIGKSAIGSEVSVDENLTI